MDDVKVKRSAPTAPLPQLPPPPPPPAAPPAARQATPTGRLDERAAPGRAAGSSSLALGGADGQGKATDRAVEKGREEARAREEARERESRGGQAPGAAPPPGQPAPPTSGGETPADPKVAAPSTSDFKAGLNKFMGAHKAVTQLGNHAGAAKDAAAKLENGDVTGAVAAGSNAVSQMASDGKAIADLASHVGSGSVKQGAETAAQHLKAGSTIAGVAGKTQAQIETAGQAVQAAREGHYGEAVDKGIQAAKGMVDTGKGAVDAVKNYTGGAVKDALTKVGGALGSHGDRLGALGAVAATGKNLAGIAEGGAKVLQGKVGEGLAEMGQNTLGAVQNVGTTASTAKTLVSEASVAGKAMGAVASGVGKLAAPIAIAQGGIQAAQALSKNPPDYKGAAVGAMNAVGGALMAVPGGQVAGAALMGGAMVVQHWDAISSGASAAWNWVSGKS